MVSREFTTAVNLESRIAALFVQNANRFPCKQLMRRGNIEINCKSIMGVVSMSVREGQVVTITATGPEENEALQTLVKMLAEA